MTEKKDNEIFVGAKEFGIYRHAIRHKFDDENFEEIVIKARGTNISKAVELAEVTRKRDFVDEVEITNIEIGSETFIKDERNMITTSISITLRKIYNKEGELIKWNIKNIQKEE